MFKKSFVRRPIFAAVLLVVISLAVGLGVLTLAVKKYLLTPPPVVEVIAVYPGASARVVADTVGVPIEQEVYGVMDMVSMSRQCSDDGSYRLTITFRRGTDPAVARVLVINRLAFADPKLPDAVKEAGIRVTTQPTN